MEKTWKIYVHQNCINGKLYIGQTCASNVRKRWRNNGKGYINSPYFYEAIQKYGWNKFNHIVLIDNIKTIDEANMIEEFLIKKYNTTNRNFGYNLQSGGESRLFNDEAKQRNSKSKIIAHQNKPEVKKVKEQFSKIEDNIENLKINSLTTKNNIRLKYRYICIETQKIYDSSIQAEKDTGINARTIRLVCSGGQKSTHNTHWDYYEEGKEYKLEDYIGNKRVSTKAKKIYCPELDIVFNSGNEAAKYMGLSSAIHIFDCCNHIRTTCQGFHWKYYNKEGIV